jgi:hypothetical protein
MKTIMKSGVYMPMAALILAATLAMPAAAQQHVPFKGTFQGHDDVTTTTITTSGTGVATHMGQLSLKNILTLSTLTGTGHWVAHNGDSIDTTFAALADVTTASLGYITVTETHTITGGTGRFAGIQGTFTLERTHITTPEADGTRVTFGSFHGIITPPAATH